MKRSLIFLIIILLTGWVAGAKVELPSILSDNMVLQRESDVNLWGKSEPGSRIRVSVSWDKRKYKTVADESGNWILAVRTPEAGGPYSIEISDGEPVVIGNVLIGDVWICAGQSNMEMPVIGFWGQPVYDSAKAIVYSENEKLVRFTTVERQTADYPLEDCTSHWYEPSMKTTPSISAIGYFFAREVSEILHIPIGVISVAWGSARMESFMTKESVIKVEGEEFYNKIKRNKAIQTRPETIFNGMIAPVTKFTSKGFLWDQGAANRSEWRDYAELTVEMVRLWRELWGNEDMPFYNISLTSLPMGKASGTDVPLIMEAQYKAVNMMDNAYIVPLTDVEAGLTPHSPDKQMIGERTAMIALVKTYGLESELVVDPPVVRDVIYDGGTVSVYYDNDCYGLCPRYEPVKGFELAGNDRVFHSAEARLDFKEKCIKVTCKEVPEPVAVRYAFRNRIESNLTNTIGMPALPYRSDDWEDSQSGERNSHKNLACKSVFLNCFPQYLAFRGESRTAYQESYESWSASIGNACGFMRKLVSEELDINPVTAEWSGRYAKEHPEKLMLVHINGEARQVVEYPEVRKRYFPGHWVYMDGSNSASDIAVGDTVIKVNDVAPFTRKGYPDRKTVPMTYLPLQVIIVKVSQDGERQWYDSEYAELKSFDEKNGTITLKRGLYDTTPSSYKAGRAYIAPVAGDLWGKHVMWYYNLSSACPKDRNGKQANELYAEEIVSWYKGGCLKEMQGIAFDVNYFDVSKKGKYWDVDNDGIPDGGWVNDRNVWMEGDVAFLKQLRNSLGNEIIISADAQHPHNQQIPVLLNGMESEGLVQHNDMWRGFSRAVNTHLYWARHTHSPYDYRYVVLKVMGPDNLRSSQMRRFGAAAAFCLGASVTAADENFLPEDFSAPNSLGKPVGQMLRYARSGMPALSLSGENLASRIRVENGDVSLRDGKVYIRAFGNDRDRELKAIIKDVDIPCGDITIFVNARAVEGRTEYAEKYDIPRIMWVRPDSLPVYEDNAQYNEYYCDLYGLFGSSGDEMSYYFREMPEGRQDIHITVTGKGEMELSGIELFAAPDIIMREFEAGYVFVNPSRMERSVKYTDSFGHDRVVAIPPVDASFVGKNRPSPLRDMETGKTLSVTDFGAIPDDGKNDWAGINAALAELKKCSLEQYFVKNLTII
ncbi:MAG: sialate O-acetylesterase [Candidatus Cryptobacteroides sp.]